MKLFSGPIRGAVSAWVHGGQINATSLPDAFASIATGSLFGVPNLVLIALVVHRLGRVLLLGYVYAGPG